MDIKLKLPELLLKKKKLLASLVMSIGLPKEKFRELKTKDNVDLVGLSLLPLRPNLSKQSEKEYLEIFLNNNLLIVPHPTEIMDAKEV